VSGTPGDSPANDKGIAISGDGMHVPGRGRWLGQVDSPYSEPASPEASTTQNRLPSGSARMT
jgi:hypothetical protein